MSRALLCCVLLVCALSCAAASLTLPAVIGSHMVLQRDSGATVWGWSQAGAKVSMVLNTAGGAGSTQSTTAGADGLFTFELGKLPASTGNSITFSDNTDAASAVTITDVAIGDVLLCSGQSNMDMTVAAVNNATAEIADSINYPGLRMFTAQHLTSWTPMTVAGSKASFNWTVSGPSAFEGGAWGVFSATCYFTGRNLYSALGGQVPIGLVDADWSGTPIEAWSTSDALAKCSSSGEKGEDAQLDEAAFAAMEFLDGMNDPAPGPGNHSVLWNGMIAPLLRMRFKLAVWYQGEANSNNPKLYSCRFPAMITDWRAKFNSVLPFFFVQLAAYPSGGSNWPAQQIAQLAALSLPNVGYATAMDLGDPQSPAGAIHPRFKQEVGARLVRAIGNIVYGQSGVVWQGPQPSAFSMIPTDRLNVYITIAPGPTADKLRFAGTTNCGFNMTDGCCTLPPFVLGSASGKTYRAAKVEVAPELLVVSLSSLPAGEKLNSIAYSYTDYAQCCLYNSNGLPMGVFNYALNSGVTDISEAVTLME